MKIGASATPRQRIALNMTPMIDVCFQLIIFFLLSLRFYAPEGDFDINMPIAAPSTAVPSPDQIPVMKVRLRARGDGELAAIYFGDRSLGKPSIDEIHRVVASLNALDPTDEADKTQRAQLEELKRQLSLKAFQPLRNEVRKMLGDQAGLKAAEDNEVELDSDYQLKYAYVMDAITAVSGYLSGGEVVHLVGKVKFTPPKRP
jgi:biopolymer transport protein ExbD